MIYISDPVGSNITGINAAYPNVWWQALIVSSVLTANIQGGGVNNLPNARYGVRLGLVTVQVIWIDANTPLLLIKRVVI